LLVAPALQRRRMQCYLGLIIADLAALLMGFGLGGYLYVGDLEGFSVGQLVLPFYLTVALYNGAYSMRALRDALSGIGSAVIALAISSAAVVFVAFYLKSSAEFSRVAFTLGGLFAAALLIWIRFQMRAFVQWRCGVNVMNELIIDDGGPEVDFAGCLRISAADYGLSVRLDDPHALDRIGLVLRNIERVIVSCPPERRLDWAMILKGANIAGEVLDEDVVRLGAQGARVAGKHGWLLVSVGPLGTRARHEACAGSGSCRSRHRGADAGVRAGCAGDQAGGRRAGAVCPAPDGARQSLFQHVQIPVDVGRRIGQRRNSLHCAGRSAGYPDRGAVAAHEH
jgi:hypothetical protein